MLWKRIIRIAAASVLAALASGVAPAAAQQQSVLITEVDGPITPVVADQLEAAVEEAAEEGYEALLVLLDTPGGLDVSMRDIVQTFLNAPVPVIVYVAPEGARAASAGTYIAMAAHVAAMAPATSIGAATPVDLQGGEITPKIINDAAAFAVTVAERRDRDVEFAEAAVREGTSITAREAEEIGAVDLVAGDLESLLDEVDGMVVEVEGETTRLDTADAIVARYEVSTFRSILGRLADPNLSFIFLSLGTLAIIYEVANPGMGFAGVAGVILLVLAFFSLSVLPVQGAGLALLVLAAALFVAELFVPGVGVLAAGGAVALILSGLFLFEGSISVSPWVFVPSAVVVGLGSLGAGRAAWRSRRTPSRLGSQALIGREVVVATSEGEEAAAFLDGAWWEIRPREGVLAPGERARVVAMDGLTLVVEHEEEGADES